MSKLRILVADDHQVVRLGLCAVLAARPGWQVCGEATTGREAVAKAETTKPDVVIMDVSMPDGDGLEATRQIRARLPDCEVVILSVHESDQLVREVIAAGARGYVLKTDAGQNLVQAVEAVSRHEPFFSARVAYRLTAEPAAGNQPLTRREREIVRLVAGSKTSKEIAAALGISTLTVETHRARVMKKLDLHSVADLVRYAIREKLAEA